jgi:hypothetical protein
MQTPGSSCVIHGTVVGTVGTGAVVGGAVVGGAVVGGTVDVGTVGGTVVGAGVVGVDVGRVGFGADGRLARFAAEISRGPQAVSITSATRPRRTIRFTP